MKRSIALGLLIGAWAAAGPLRGAPAEAGPGLHHRLQVSLDPAAASIRVTDTVRLPAGMAGPDGLTFWLHGNLAITSVSAGAVLSREQGTPAAARPRLAGDVPLTGYRLMLAPSSAVAAAGETVEVTLTYAGRIDHPLRQAGGEYARGFSETPGLVSGAGAYLAGASVWVPWFDDRLFTYRLECDLPGEWDVVSSGRRLGHAVVANRRQAAWLAVEPVEEVYLVAGPFHEYGLRAGRVEVMAFLRSADDALASRYLQATGQYLEMYEKLIGPYPYPGFALVENFWETGYGMPSFTLLGPQVIRFPFILTSSYPHELLHNWWGNGVYVAAAGGNWCEGLTTYLADHLIKEQQGQGADYRRTALQEYTHYAAGKPGEFPLNRFTARSDALSSAIGYSKSMMILHMLRGALGDAAFTRALQQFYLANLFRQASFADLGNAFQVAGADLGGWFAQWLQRPGAPELRLSGARVTRDGDAFRLQFVLHQVQAESPYSLSVPLAVTLDGQAEAEVRRLPMNGRRRSFTLRFERRPLRLDVDPEFDLFRKLHVNETPPSFATAFGAERVLIVLPQRAAAEMAAAYRALAQAWADDRAKQIEVCEDGALSELPADRSVWLLGRENRFRPIVASGLAGFGVSLDEAGVSRGSSRYPWAEQSLALVVRHPRDPGQAVALLAADRPAALPGLGRKLPHYGKYGFLAFSGDEPVNTAKEVWPASGSPLVAMLGPQAAGRAALPRRPALAEAPVAFSAEAMMETVRGLASAELEGRGIGSKGLEKAAARIAVAFRDAGLQPGGDDRSFMQTWQAEALVQQVRQTVTLRNVVGFVPGSKAEWADEAVVVCAHYDHLGLGWPVVHAGDEGRIHPGADDNASGVAVLVELARRLGGGPRPARSVLFVAFSGEESGLLGSAHFVAALNRGPFKRVFAALNLDTVGRLPAGGKLLVIGGASAREWPFLFMGVTATTGIPVELAPQELASGDQVSFIAAGIPAVQLFAGANPDYHRPSDTADKISSDSLVKTATVANEALLYLAERAEPLHFGGATAAAAPAASPAGERAATGITPDFAYSGAGVRVAALAPGSPAEAAGLQPGDVVVKLGDADVVNLLGYSAALKRFRPGDKARLVFLRAGRTMQAEVTFARR